MVIERLIKTGLATLIVAGLFFPSIASHDPPATVATTTPAVMPAKKPLPALPPIFKHIAQCESQSRQFNSDGTVHRGEQNPKDIGLYQINEYWNGDEAKSLGLDIYTVEGNTAMALVLYKRNGLRDWEWSRWCWGKYLEG